MHVIRSSAFILCCIALAACGNKSETGGGTAKTASQGAPTPPATPPPSAGVTKATCVLDPTEGNDVHGTVTFTQEGDVVLVHAEITGLTPGKHGFHVHEKGDCSAPDGSSAGGHFNPTHKKHGAPTDEERHVGDLGNVVADKDGNATLDWRDPVIQLNGPNSIVGKSVIVHGGADDLVSQPSGNAGPRVACGVIEAAGAGH
jgi:superoxide dismutase, Cu-Zn family